MAKKTNPTPGKYYVIMKNGEYYNVGKDRYYKTFKYATTFATRDQASKHLDSGKHKFNYVEEFYTKEFLAAKLRKDLDSMATNLVQDIFEQIRSMIAKMKHEDMTYDNYCDMNGTLNDEFDEAASKTKDHMGMNFGYMTK